MSSNTNTKQKGSKRKCTKGPATPPYGEKKSGLNTALRFVELAKDTDYDEETIRVKVCIDNTISKYDKTNYNTKSFKAIETFVYNGAEIVKTLCAIDLDTFTPYSLKVQFLTKKRLGIFLRVLKVTTKMQLEEAIQG